jgi:hypothetical protein
MFLLCKFIFLQNVFFIGYDVLIIITCKVFPSFLLNFDFKFTLIVILFSSFLFRSCVCSYLDFVACLFCTCAGYLICSLAESARK